MLNYSRRSLSISIGWWRFCMTLEVGTGSWPVWSARLCGISGQTAWEWNLICVWVGGWVCVCDQCTHIMCVWWCVKIIYVQCVCVCVCVCACCNLHNTVLVNTDSFPQYKMLSGSTPRQNLPHMSTLARLHN